MTDRVLSDAEMQECYSAVTYPGKYGIARAVEAAVLAKVPDHLRKQGEYREGGYSMYARDILREAADILDGCAGASRFTLVTEREARKRERAAFMDGFEYFRSGGKSDCNNRCPVPTKRVPRTVVLSDGTRVSSLDGTFRWKIDRGENGGHFNTGDRPYCHARTPADARLLADLVERPYDEVPEP